MISFRYINNNCSKSAYGASRAKVVNSSGPYSHSLKNNYLDKNETEFVPKMNTI